jgi:hypothetical protein
MCCHVSHPNAMSQLRAVLALHPGEEEVPPLLSCYALYTAACRLELAMGLVEGGAERLNTWWLLEQAHGLNGVGASAASAAAGGALHDPQETLAAFLQQLGTSASIKVGARMIRTSVVACCCQSFKQVSMSISLVSGMFS